MNSGIKKGRIQNLLEIIIVNLRMVIMALIIMMGVLVLPVKTITISQSKEMGIMTSKFDAVYLGSSPFSFLLLFPLSCSLPH